MRRLFAATVAVALTFVVQQARAEDSVAKAPIVGGDYDNGILFASLPLASRTFIAEGRSIAGPLQTFGLRGADVGLVRPIFTAYTSSLHYFKGPLFVGTGFSIGGGAHDAPFPQSGPGLVGDARSVSYLDVFGEGGAQLVRGPFFARATVLIGWRRLAFDVNGCDCGAAVLASGFVQPRLHLAYALAGGDTMNDNAGFAFLLGGFAGVDVYPPLGATFGVTLTFRGGVR
jgi:hypothetical protein